MRYAILSDSHDNLANLEQALAMARQAGISHGIHLGDFCKQPTLDVLAASGLSWVGVWGNNDRGLTVPAGLDIQPGDSRELKLEGRQLFLTHYPQIARIAALSGRYDAAFHGHNHRDSQEMVGQTLLANPGEILGWRFGKPSFAIYDPADNSFQILRLPTKKRPHP